MSKAKFATLNCPRCRERLRLPRDAIASFRCPSCDVKLGIEYTTPWFVRGASLVLPVLKLPITLAYQTGRLFTRPCSLWQLFRLFLAIFIISAIDLLVYTAALHFGWPPSIQDVLLAVGAATMLVGIILPVGTLAALLVVDIPKYFDLYFDVTRRYPTICCPGCGEEYDLVQQWSCSCGYVDHRPQHFYRFICPLCGQPPLAFNCPRCGVTILR